MTSLSMGRKTQRTNHPTNFIIIIKTEDQGQICFSVFLSLPLGSEWQDVGPHWCSGIRRAYWNCDIHGTEYRSHQDHSWFLSCPFEVQQMLIVRKENLYLYKLTWNWKDTHYLRRRSRGVQENLENIFKRRKINIFSYIIYQHQNWTFTNFCQLIN